MTLPILNEILNRTRAGEALALCVVVSTRGSTPQGAGAKMLCLLNGTTIGTLGGGCVEAEVRRKAMELLNGGQSQLLTFRLDSDYGWDDGLICGGTMDILVHLVRSPTDAAVFAPLADALQQGQPAQLVLPYERNGQASKYIEDLGPPPVLVIAGAGHVGQALATLASQAGFDVDVIDDRTDYANRERFPTARQLMLGEIETSLRQYPTDADTYIVIVTRGHRNDGRALEAVVRSPAKYVGLIGSKSKIKLIFREMLANGVALDDLLRVHAPIGLNIGSVTVPEIAISIAAELVAVRRGVQVAGAMRMAQAELRVWLKG
ncbi:MAG TPA: XdhC/CoxI family protein [Tepidisphaeraceae bacterium]|jgi:xanthine dehydrogenase accessory factor|nr:XdhC/CoxI family protein [Tepidisphaeraceae bacterium]